MKKTIETKTAKDMKTAISLVKEFFAPRVITFEFDTENYGESLEDGETYRHFNGTNENGIGGYAMIEIFKGGECKNFRVINGELKVIRVFNFYRDTVIDIVIENFVYEINENRFQVNVRYEVSENGIIANGENQALNSKSEVATEEATETAIDKLVITTKERPDGTPTAYYVNGVKTNKHKIEFYYANNPAYSGLIEIDHYVARYYLPEIYNNKSRVVFKNWADTGKTIVTKAAADELGLRIGRKVSLNPALYLVEETVEENIEVDPADYAITSEAMDVATNAEIENANAANMEETIEQQIEFPYIDIEKRWVEWERNFDQARFYADKRDRERKSYSEDEVWSLIPDVSEFNSDDTRAELEIKLARLYNNKELLTQKEFKAVERKLLNEINGTDDEPIDATLDNVDTFKIKLTELQDEYDAATVAQIKADEELFKVREVVRELEKKAFAAENTAFKAKCAYYDCLREIATDLTTKLISPDVFNKTILITTQSVTKIEKSLFGLRVDSGYKSAFTIKIGMFKCGDYDTPVQIETVIGMLKAAVTSGDKDFIFPTIEELSGINEKEARRKTG